MAEQQGPICISVINMKGGVGKTTVAAMLGRYAAEQLGLNVLAIDLDPQANLSQVLMGERAYQRFLDEKEPSIVELFSGYRPPSAQDTSPQSLGADSVVHSSSTPNLLLIPSRFDFADALNAAIGKDEQVLARFIATSCQDLDFIIVDCAPTESLFTRVAYHASRYILVPVRPEFLATIGFPLLHDSLEAFTRKNRGHAVDVIGVVVNDSNYQPGPEESISRAEIRNEAVQNSWHIFNNRLSYSKGFLRIMRGDKRYTRNANTIFNAFASEFFARPELSALQSRQQQGSSTP